MNFFGSKRQSHLIHVKKYEVPLPDLSNDEIQQNNDAEMSEPGPNSPEQVKFASDMNEDPTPRKSDIHQNGRLQFGLDTFNNSGGNTVGRTFDLRKSVDGPNG